MVVVTQGTQQHTLAGIQGLAVGTNRNTVETSAEYSLDNTPAVGVFVSLAAQLVGGRCHHGVKTKVAYVYGVAALVDLEYVYLVGSTFYKILNIQKILSS